MNLVELIKIDMDTMENTPTYDRTSLGIFKEEGTGTKSAHGVASEWMHVNLKPQKMYTGWDGKVYPQFILEEKETVN